MVICFRILTGRKKTAVYYKMFSNAKPDSIFGRLSSLVSKDDKETGLGAAINKIKTTEDKLTLFYGKPGMMNHPENNCDLRFVWLSPQAGYTSFAFPKISPLYPFFIHFFTKMLETGELDKTTKIWGPRIPNCKSNEVKQKKVSFSKVVLPFCILIGGTLFSFGIFVSEVHVFKQLNKTQFRAVVRPGAMGAIPPFNFETDGQMAPVD